MEVAVASRNSANQLMCRVHEWFIEYVRYIDKVGSDADVFVLRGEDKMTYQDVINS